MLSSLAGCATVKRPHNVNNICAIFRQYPDWYWATQQAEKRWGVPISVQMAIMHQESRFAAKARPARRKLLWIIPWTRPSNAYGYTQALKMTWKHYKKSTGHRWVSRNDFSDATDFVGWYVDQAWRQAGIAKTDAYRLYLAYHEGVGGYQRKTYLKKEWLIRVSQRVKRRATTYRSQLQSCQSSLKTKPWYRPW